MPEPKLDPYTSDLGEDEPTLDALNALAEGEYGDFGDPEWLSKYKTPEARGEGEGPKDRDP